MEQAVEATARPGGEVAALDERGAQAAHGQVAQHAGTGGSAADDDDIDLGAEAHPRCPRSRGSVPRR